VGVGEHIPEGDLGGDSPWKRDLSHPLEGRSPRRPPARGFMATSPTPLDAASGAGRSETVLIQGAVGDHQYGKNAGSIAWRIIVRYCEC